MGKHGPCYHCGTTSTPLWRNGPPEKPILCNACGSRWRTKGSLANYTPLHARTEPNEYEDYSIPRVKIMSINNKEPKVLKRKQNHENMIRSKEIASDCKHGLLKTIDEDASNRSSSGSAISNSESCVQFGSVEANDLTAQSIEWEHMVPSRKRTCVNRPKQSRMEKLTKDLYTILHAQQQSSHFSGSSEEDLLFESDQPMVSVEIGHGSVLIRHPSSVAQEEESEASSVTVENKGHLVHDTHSRSTAFPLSMSKGEMEDNKRPGGPGMHQEIVIRCKDDHEKLTILRSNNSPLCRVDLKEIVNFDVFTSHLTNEEQQQLLRYLPDLDTGLLPQSFQSMFSSLKFKENLLSFQKLLSEGVLDLAFSGAKTEDCDALKRISLSGSEKSKWVEQDSRLKDEEAKGSKKGANLLAYNTSTKLKRSRVNPGTKSAMKGPGHKDLVDKDGSCFQRSLFPLPCNSQSMGSVQSMDENTDHDLLLDVPSNNSFPEAELLYQTSHSSSSLYPQLIRP